MYKVKVTEIGSFVEELLNEKMVVLFGPTAPAELRDICVVHDGTPTEDNGLLRAAPFPSAIRSTRLRSLVKLRTRTWEGSVI